LRNAFDGLVFEGMKLSDALTDVAQDILDTVYDVAMKPVQGALGGFLGNGLNGLLGGVMPFANGGVFSQGRVTAFAKGGVVAEPTGFAMRGGRGLMGEAGPEAIVPLARGADGKLGIRAGGGGGNVSVTMNISTPDAASFRRSQSQVAAEMSRAIQRGRRNL
jgi:phage-related minor tail protein